MAHRHQPVITPPEHQRRNIQPGSALQQFRRHQLAHTAMADVEYVIDISQALVMPGKAANDPPIDASWMTEGKPLVDDAGDTLHQPWRHHPQAGQCYPGWLDVQRDQPPPEWDAAAQAGAVDQHQALHQFRAVESSLERDRTAQRVTDEGHTNTRSQEA